MIGQEEERGIGLQIGAIEGLLVPDTTASNRLRVIVGGLVRLTIRVKNVGTATISPYYWLRVHEVSLIGTGKLLHEWRYQMPYSISTGGIATIREEFNDGPEIGWRDVFLKISPTSDMSKPSYPGGEDSWADAYEVTKSVAGVEILELTLS